MVPVEMIPVVSSNIGSIGYDDAQFVLYVLFNNGVTYAYFGVPPEVHVSLMASGSKGGYLAQAVKDVYDYSIV